jgi:hypothetical protein
MKFFSSDRRFLLDVLLDFQKKTADLGTGHELCDLVQSLAVMMEAVMPGTSYKERPPDSKKLADSNVDANKTLVERDCAQEDSNDFDSPLVIEYGSIDGELMAVCENLMHRSAIQAMHGMDELSASELRKLLTVYALLPFQADDLIQMIELNK